MLHLFQLLALVAIRLLFALCERLASSNSIGRPPRAGLDAVSSGRVVTSLRIDAPFV